MPRCVGKGLCRREHGQGAHYKGQNRPHRSCGKTEEESATASFLRSCPNGAYAEEAARLAVFLYYATAVHQSETVSLVYFALKHCIQLLRSHAATVVAYGYFHVTVALFGGYAYLAALRSELAGVVSEGVEHEESEHFVGLHDGIGVANSQFDALHTETGLTLCHHGEQRGERKSLYVKTQLPDTHLYPLREHTVVFIYLGRKLHDILPPFLPCGFVFGARR